MMRCLCSCAHAVQSVGLRLRLALVCGFVVLSSPAFGAEPFELELRHRIETAADTGRFHAVSKTERWDPAKTAIIVCDVWDLHTSRNATLRTGELAPRINELVAAVRERGGTVLHCPSGCMDHYANHPARKATLAVPKAAKLPPEIGQWCYSIPAEERGEYPLDQSDGGQDDDPRLQTEWSEYLTAIGRKTRGPWIKQHDAVGIKPGDFISDKGEEVWSILEARGIENVFMTGVHTNMCVLGRPFGLRRLASNGKNVVLVRDLTDTMYNPAKRPYVSHFTGTDLIVEHIEKFVCPTVTSDKVLGGEPFVFKDDDRPHVVIAISEPEYETEKTLPAFAKRHLGRHFKVSIVFGDEKDGNELPGLEVLEDADLLLLSMRRRALRPEQMKLIREFLEAGKPIVGIRTSSHALSLRGKEPPEGRMTWESFDADIFGGNYSNHYGKGPAADVSAFEGAHSHPILTGVGFKGWTSPGSLYQVSPLKESATPLIRGKLEGHPGEPVAWTNTTTFGGRAFYTSLGHSGDFESASFRRLLFNSLFWALDREVPAKMPDAVSEEAGEVEASRNQSRLRHSAPLLRNRENAPRLDREFVAFLADEGDGRSGETGEQASSPPLDPSPNPQFTTPDDLEWELVLSEPVVRQPVFMDFDERGRLWVVQYLQYPNPAGLTMLSKDRHWRAVYDKVPKAPPHHERGADAITIHEDTDGDGTFDSHKTFVEGLSIVTSFARGRGGVFVLNPPYLLFYPDGNNDDVPDGDPEVLLAGFGLEDTHSVANSLRFGPDGWLYACQGSTVSGQVVRPGTDDKPIATMGQLIWRYHPERRIYEVFAEGGGNAFGLEIDANGEIYSGHNGGDTRGFHYIQGGYYRKGFEKHGPLSNPHTYGYFEPMKHAKVPRFTHNFVIYEGDALPGVYRGKLFGIEPLQGQVTLTEITRLGSTFETVDLFRSVRSDETSNFRPVHITTGPDGAIYVADFHEQYIAHRDHFEGRINKETGRIYRLKPKSEPRPLGSGSARPGVGAKPLPSGRGSDELLELLEHPNRWHRQTALRLIADRQDTSIVPRLREELFGDDSRKRPSGGLGPKPKDLRSLEYLWALYQLGGLDEATTLQALDHGNPHVRSWAVRLTCDDGAVEPAIAKKLVALAKSEKDVRVRVQLACSARRVPVETTLALVEGLLTHEDDREDPFLPLSVWWAIEAKCSSDPDAVVAFFSRHDVWASRLAREVIAERLMRRFASGSRSDLTRSAVLLDAAPDKEIRKRFLAGFDIAFRGRSASALPDSLVAALSKTGELPLSLRVRQGDDEAIAEAIRRLNDRSVPAAERAELATLLGESRPPESLPVLLALFDTATDARLRSAVLGALGAYQDLSIPEKLITALPDRRAAEQIAILSVLVSRADWAGRLVGALQSGDVAKEAVPLDLARRLTLHGESSLSAAATELWPELTVAENRSAADLQSLERVIVAESGDPYRGKRLYEAACSRCHKLFGEGGEVGPDLTSDPRNDLSRLLGAIIAPSAEIREGFESHVAVTADGRVISGLLIDEDEHLVVLREADGRAVSLTRDEIEAFVRQPKSLMPDGLLNAFGDQEIRDLFAYLRSSQPLNE